MNEKLLSYFFEKPNYQQLYEDNKNTHIGSVPVEIQRKIFDFFGLNDLIRAARVCKDFRILVGKIFEEAKVFYCVGSDVSTHEKVASGQDINYRYYEPFSYRKFSLYEMRQNIIKSILNIPVEIVIFSTLTDALEYSRSERKVVEYLAGNIGNIMQPAIITVKYLGTASDIKWQHSKVQINPDRLGDCTDYDEIPRETVVKYFKTHRKSICTMSGQLLMHAGNKGEFYSFPPIDFRKDANEIKAGIKPGCILF